MEYINDYNLQMAMAEYEDLRLNRLAWTPNGTKIGRVTQVYDNTDGNGEQVFAIVSDPSQAPDQVQEVTVLFRGSTGPNEVLTKPADVWNDWVENDALIGLRIFAQDHPNYTQDHDHASGQLKAASTALNDIMSIYPNAKFNLYGHSLGSMDTQYAMANLSETNIKRIKSAHIYNGPNIYGILDDQQKARVDSIKGLIHNYADPKDPISMVGRQLDRGSLDSVGMVHFVDSKDLDIGNQHMTYGYQLDSSGRIKLLQTPSTEGLNEVVQAMSQYHQMKQTLSSGGFSSHETIYLDSEQARIAARGLSRIAELSHQKIQQLSAKAIEEANALYSSLDQVPFGFVLSPEEVREAYQAAGVDYQSLVGDIANTVAKYEERSAKLHQELLDLESQIQAGIDKKLSDDQALAQEIRGWTDMMN